MEETLSCGVNENLITPSLFGRLGPKKIITLRRFHPCHVHFSHRRVI
jgi:hypothetical protein